MSLNRLLLLRTAIFAAWPSIPLLHVYERRWRVDLCEERAFVKLTPELTGKYKLHNQWSSLIFYATLLD